MSQRILRFFKFPEPVSLETAAKIFNLTKEKLDAKFGVRLIDKNTYVVKVISDESESDLECEESSLFSAK